MPAIRFLNNYLRFEGHVSIKINARIFLALGRPNPIFTGSI